MMGTLAPPFLLVTLAVIQTILCLLLLRGLDLYQHEPLSSVALMTAWGATGAALVALWATQPAKTLVSARLESVFDAAIAPPVIEETAKGVALIAAFTVAEILHRRLRTARLTGVTTGVVFGAAIGLGFAFTEDVAYLLARVVDAGLAEGGAEFVARRDFLGFTMLQHALFSACFGAALGLATISRTRLARFGLPLVGLAVAVALHAMNNGLVNAQLVSRFGLDAVAGALHGGSVPSGFEAAVQTANRTTVVCNLLVLGLAAVALALWLRRQRRVIIEELPEEVANALIDPRDAERVPNYLRRLGYYWELMRIGEIDRAVVERRLHIELARLAFVKRWERWKPDGEQVVRESRQRVRTLVAQRSVDVYIGG